MPKKGRTDEIFHFVVFRRARSVSVDIVDIVRRQAGIGDSVANASNNGLSVGARPSAVEGISHLTASLHDSQNLRTTRRRGLVTFKNKCAGALSHDETIAILRKRFGRRVWNVVAGRKGRKK